MKNFVHKQSYYIIDSWLCIYKKVHKVLTDPYTSSWIEHDCMIHLPAILHCKIKHKYVFTQESASATPVQQKIKNHKKGCRKDSANKDDFSDIKEIANHPEETLSFPTSRNPNRPSERRKDKKKPLKPNGRFGWNCKRLFTNKTRKRHNRTKPYFLCDFTSANNKNCQFSNFIW